MNTHDTLMAAICAEPDDDVRRLAFADWLEENAGMVACRACKGMTTTRHGLVCTTCRGSGRVPDGNAARAEFVRVQVELARVLCPLCHVGAESCRDPDGCPRSALRRREGELLSGEQDRQRREWVELAGHRSDCYWEAWEFRRGFVDSITLTAADWLAHADKLAWHPGQTVKCPECKGLGSRAFARTRYCATCKKGTVPRPCPPTAQPITTVTLTTLGDDPDQFCIDNDFSVTRKDGRSLWTSPRWPGITFHLPPQPED